MFIQPIRVNTQNNSKPAFQRKFSVQTLAKAISKETTDLTPNQKLAKLFKKQQEGPLSDLKKTFNPDELEGFWGMGFIKKDGQNWKKTETGDKYISQFYKEPIAIEKYWGHNLARIGF